MATNLLSAAGCKNATSNGASICKFHDGDGLYLWVYQDGRKYWRMRYWKARKEKSLSLGVYPKISLSDARKKRDELRSQLQADLDPSAERKAAKSRKNLSAESSFEAVAREWYGKKLPTWAPTTARKVIRQLEKDVFPWIGKRPIKDIAAPELLATLRRMEGRGALELAHRVREYCGMVFRYAVAIGKAERDPSGDLKGALAPVKTNHHASVTDPKKIGELLRAIGGYTGSFMTKCALQLAPLVFVRPGELRTAEWVEFDLDAAEWRIPGEKMKMRCKHIVPLSQQALEILRAVYPLTGGGRYVFPSVRTTTRPMSENTINAALRRMGYEKDEMTGHGFRSMASTLLHEQGWPHEVIERQLAHSERNKVSAAYNYAEHLPKRREMMQHWSDYLNGLARGADVLPLRGKAA